SALHTIFRIVTAISLIRLVGFGLFRLLLPLMGRVLPRIVEDVVILILYVIYGLAQLRGAGVDLSSIVTTSAILTAVIAFAMQDTLGNLLGGLSIQIDNTVQVGDWVRVDDLAGQVRDIRWRSTLIETRNWETIVIPNSVIMKGRVAILGKREVTRRREMLGRVDLFTVLSEDEMNELAERLQYAPFARGDVITKQGNVPHWLYIVAFGEVEVRYEPPHGAPQVISTLRAGQFFGEMALLTGEARSATVIALTDVECYRLDVKSFQTLMHRRPEI